MITTTCEEKNEARHGPFEAHDNLNYIILNFMSTKLNSRLAREWETFKIGELERQSSGGQRASLLGWWAGAGSSFLPRRLLRQDGVPRRTGGCH